MTSLWIRLAVIPMVVGGLCGACGGGGDSEDDRATRPRPLPTERTSTEDVTSVIARTRPEVQNAITLVDNSCSIFAGQTCGPLGQTNLLTLELTSQTMELRLNGVIDPETPNYEGPPPQQLEGLIDSTLDALRAIPPATQALMACLQANAGSNGACAGEQGGKDRAVFQLEDELQAWDAYL